MKLVKPIKQKIVIPVPSGIGYRCPCGNRLCNNQKKCEICEALVDWSSVEIKGLHELEKRRYRKMKKKVTLEEGEICIKGRKDFVNWLVVSAFRYCVTRHTTQAMYGVGDVILDNLDVLHTEFIRQFIRDIQNEQRITEIHQEYSKKEAIDFWYRLRTHIKDYQGYLADDKSEDCQQLLKLLGEVVAMTEKIGGCHKWGKLKINLNEDTTYLTPMLNRLQAEYVKREGREYECD
jgi:hypothetical protein